MSSGHRTAYHGPGAAGDIRVGLVTGRLSAQQRTDLRHCLDLAYAGDFSDHDFDHALGGVHAFAHDGETLVGHAAVVERRLVVWSTHVGIRQDAAVALRAGYIEAVAVTASHRRRGIATRLLRALASTLDTFDLGALSTGTPEVYAASGWQLWRGPTYVLRDGRRRRTGGDDGGIMVRPGQGPLDLDGPIACFWRPGDVW